MNAIPSKGESSNAMPAEKLFARLSVGSYSRGRGRSRSPSNCSAYSEGESAFEEDEEDPAEPFFDKEFQLALEGGVGIAREIANTLQGYQLEKDPPSDLYRLWKEAAALRGYGNPETRVIGVVGDSGGGKSSLINSLLDQPGLAKTSGGGSACTSIVTEYRCKTDRHTEPYTIEVRYMDSAKIQNQIEELIWSYRQLYIEGTEQQASDFEYKRYQSESELAWHTLEAAFGHRKELTPEYLQDSSKGAVDRISKQLTTWAHELDWPGDGKGVWISTAATVKECGEKTSIFAKSYLWPFTEVIRIFLNAKVLDTGVVLADLPGFHDTNLARVTAARKYLDNCDEIFIVAGIARAITDSKVKSCLQALLKDQIGIGWESHAKQVSNIAIICTHAEDIELDTARDDDFCKGNIDLAKIQDLDEEIQDADEKEDKLRGKLARQKQKYMLIGARNAHVTKRLKQAYSDLISGSDLRVFCIGNRDYKKFTSPRGRRNFVFIDATGVPGLRRFCRSVPAKAQFEAGLQFLETQIPALLHSVDLWVSMEPEADAKVKPGDVDDDLEYLEEVINTLNYHLSFLLMVTEVVASTKEDIRARLLEVVGGTIAQYSAWCRHNGTYATPRQSHRRWNMEITEMATGEMEAKWRTLRQMFCDLFTALRRDVNQGSRNSYPAFRPVDIFNTTETRRSSQSTMVFLENGKLRQDRIKYLLNQSLVEFLRGFKAIQRNSTEDHPGSYILNGMLATYRWCSTQSGNQNPTNPPSDLDFPRLTLTFPHNLDRGMLDRQRNMMHDHLHSGNLFRSVNNSIERDFDDLLEKTFDHIDKNICDILEQLGEDVALLKKVPEGRSDRSPELEREVKNMLSRMKIRLAGVQKGVRETKMKFQERE
ncbi:hypothetical protein FGG08_002257 [Glutinoglossum americanum]|uniref:Uncharacterized protein n=1 Tax=Glutinoglossum americanum TaxID=1670608 RepID=A0A9P8L4L6_9PEZI|nr:hypothetical protein FGG08_002257 [Glutinoglossum americanum]